LLVFICISLCKTW